jgi:hypothetical protein
MRNPFEDQANLHLRESKWGKKSTAVGVFLAIVIFLLLFCIC